MCYLRPEDSDFVCKHVMVFLKNELSHIHMRSSCNVAPNNVFLIMFTKLSSQGSDGLWSGRISTLLLLAAGSISNRNTLKTLTNTCGGGSGKINSMTFCDFGLLPQCNEICIFLGIYTADVSGQPIGPIFKGQAVQQEFLLVLLDP